MKSPSLTDPVTRMIRLAALVTLVGCLIMVPATAARAHGDHDARPLLRQAEAVPIWVLTVSDFGGPDLASTARGAWTALYFWSYLVVLALGCAIRLRRTA